MSEKSFFMRLADLKADLATQPIKKSGYNNHLRYNYFQLSDFEPVLATLGAKYGIFHYFSFPVEHVELHVCDAFSDKEIVTCCGYAQNASGKNIHNIQDEGAVQTYSRRYLLMAFYGITDGDLLEMINGMNSDLVSKEEDIPNTEPATAKSPKPKAMVTAQSPKPAPATSTKTPEQADIENAVKEGWKFVIGTFGYKGNGDKKTNDEAITGAKNWLNSKIGIDNAKNIKSVDMLTQFQSAVDRLKVETEAMKPKGPEEFEGDLL